MLLKTHLLAGLFCALIFLPVENQLIFLGVVLIASIIPDIDSRFSTVGKRKILRIFQFFVKHRGFIHSLTFLIIMGGVLWYFIPIVLLPFLIGYGSHLLMDCFTKQGIRLFYPINIRVRGFVKTGRRFETLIFVLLLIGNLVLIFDKLIGVF
jgi:inner membrane protein